MELGRLGPMIMSAVAGEVRGLRQQRDRSHTDGRVAGVNTHACVRMTAIDAYQRDLDVIIPKEAVGSYDRIHGDMSLRYMDGKIASIVSIAELASRFRS
jgi:isochorismate hydrolase